jgi:multidrug efflux pump subunit AcrA (membrane-fusion protein)
MKKCHYLTTLALLLALLSCQNESNKPVSSASPVKVKVMQASSSATSESRHFSGTVEESSTTSLSFPVMGTVKKIYVDLFYI